MTARKDSKASPKDDKALSSNAPIANPKTPTKVGHTVNSSPVSTATFYGDVSQTPRLKRTQSSRLLEKITTDATYPSKHGSAHTKYTFSTDNPETESPLSATQRTRADEKADSLLDSQSTQLSSLTAEPLDDYREPEAVPEWPPATQTELVYPTTSTNAWEASDTSWNAATPTWNPTVTPLIASNDYDEPLPYNWWDRMYEKLTPQRPGPGHLASVVEANILEDTLFRVTVPTIPHYPACPPEHALPSLDEIRSLIPPDMYYSKTRNAWIYLKVSQDKTLPTSYHEFHNLGPLPATWTRENRATCLKESPGDSTWSYGQDTVKAHHFHLYGKSVDSTCLDVPLQRLAGHYLRPDGSVGSSHGRRDPVDDDVAFDIRNPFHQYDGYPLDLYACSRCATHVLVSHAIPGVIPLEIINGIVADRSANPTVGKTPDSSIASALELVVRVMDNFLFKGSTQAVNVSSNSVKNVLGWNEHSEALFGILGFRPIPGDEIRRLEVPNINPDEDNGRQNRATFLKAWLEIQAWLSQHRVQRAFELKAHLPTIALNVETNSIRPDFQRSIGSNPELMPRPPIMSTLTEIQKQYTVLGMTSTAHSPELVEFAYKQQLRCDPIGTPLYLEALTRISETPQVPGADRLANLAQIERSKGLWSQSDLERSTALIGFGEDNAMRIPFERDVGVEFLIGAFQNAWREAGAMAAFDDQQTQAYRRDLKDALKITCQYLGNPLIVQECDNVLRLLDMSPAQAYNVLGASKDTDDEILLVAFNLQLNDHPQDAVKLREALSLIAEDRNSDRIRQFLQTGTDPGEGAVANVKMEWPRGLHQLGNTCYLNSLLQYFYTIKDLREALESGTFQATNAHEEDEFKRKPIGGRLISERELARSRSFVQHLHGLFINLAHADVPAVLPEVQLAKLALMTSKDEEEESMTIKTAATSVGSNDTDSTLVEAGADGATAGEDSVPRLSPVSDAISSPSLSTVLGKRPGESLEQARDGRPSPMDVDNALSLKVSSSVLPVRPTADVDVEMTDASLLDAHPQKTLTGPPPPLPPRKRKETAVGEMMFGKQNDVAECMDNCIFQIEAALEFDPPQAASSSKTDSANVVKRLFYGKKRQRIWPAAEENKPEPTVSEKEDIFAQLLVNVSDEGFDLYDGLGGFLDDTVEFEGRKAKMEVNLLELPPVLQIQLQRVQFDRKTLQPKKNNAYVKFDDTLYMDRFMEGADPVKKARSRAIQADLQRCRDRVTVLLESPGVPYSEALTSAKELLAIASSDDLPEADESLQDYLRTESEHLSAEIEGYRTQAKALKEELESLWADEKSAEYELCSVFIHRGTSPSWGHYFFYSRDLPNNPDSWFKYNDSEVSVVKKEEVFADGTGSTANPYLLVYARKGANVIDTVHRILPVPTDP